VFYSGFGSELNDADYGGTDHYSWTSGATATIYWYGTQLSIQGWTAPNFGIADICTDGSSQTAVDWYSPTITSDHTVYTTPELALGPHVTTVIVTNTHDAWSPGGQVTLDSFTATVPASIVTVDDSSTGRGVDQVFYSGFGSESGDAEYGGGDADYGGSDHYSWTTGATATIYWYGTRLSIQGWTAPNFGIADICTDGSLPDAVDWYGPTIAYDQTIYTSPQVAVGPHVTTIYVTNTHDPWSPGGQVTLDSFAALS
jgi:hypothetical protein